MGSFLYKQNNYKILLLFSYASNHFKDSNVHIFNETVTMDIINNCIKSYNIQRIFPEMSSNNFYLNRGYFVQNKTNKITQDYTFGKQLGKGAYGTVFAAKSKVSQKIRAIKQIKRQTMRNQIQFMNQMQILKKVDHPNIIKIYETYEEQNKYYVVTDFCEGGQLFDRLIQKGKFSQFQARQIFRQMVYAIKYCHGQKIAHRDLKPQNFLFLNKHSNSLKLIDFGLSYQWKQDMKAQIKAKGQNKLIGTSYYIAPDIIKGDYSQKCDIWSLGVILYILVTAVPPFDGQNDRKILQAVRNGVYTFDIPEMKNISIQLKDLISKILQPQQTRYTIDQILAHPWMTSQLSKKDLKINFSKLKRYASYCQLKKFAVNCIASQLTGKQIQYIGQLFKQIDNDMDGFINTKELKQALDRQKQKISHKQLQQIVQLIDTDRNGKINYHQFIACCAESTLLLQQQNLRYVFRSLDTDCDGKITINQLRKGFMIGHYSVDEQSILAIIQQCDRNGDGKIDYDEFVVAICQI